MSQYAHLSTPDPTVPAIPKFPGVINRETMPAMRERFQVPPEQRVAQYEGRLPAETAYKLTDHTVPVDGGEITVRVIIPTSTAQEGPEFEFPVLVHYHGGGWSIGSIDGDDLGLRILSVATRVVTVNVGYRLAPENPFPIPLNDSYTALKWTVSNAKSLRISLAKGFFVGGVSAGGELAAVMTQKSIQDPFFTNTKITGNILSVPLIIHPDAYPTEYAHELLSVKQNADAPILDRTLMDAFLDCHRAPPTSPDFSPLLGSREGLPPTYLQICGLDPLRDEGLLWERLLREQGTPTKLDIYPGVPHGFPPIFPGSPLGKKWHADWEAGVKWLLSLVKA
ncbi:Esterase/lipase/thioesterase [Favolaschia claudopus]|uniref:Esterase/lipase/thioesterase n=1 Tax=Favolaschia claudopus TaxID=2862362 RepID=A0AAW0DH40_9AGAR